LKIEVKPEVRTKPESNPDPEPESESEPEKKEDGEIKTPDPGQFILDSRIQRPVFSKV